jgi:HSP20 family protein
MSDQSNTPSRSMATRSRRWDPFSVLTEMGSELERLLGGTQRGVVPATAVWIPRVDVYEQDGAIMVEAELPGVKKEDIEVAIEDGELVIRGERKSERRTEEQGYYRMERSYGRFYRRLPLPDDVNPDQIEARFDNGVLNLRIPRQVPAQQEPKKIPIT